MNIKGGVSIPTPVVWSLGLSIGLFLNSPFHFWRYWSAWNIQNCVSQVRTKDNEKQNRDHFCWCAHHNCDYQLQMYVEKYVNLSTYPFWNCRTNYLQNNVTCLTLTVSPLLFTAHIVIAIAMKENSIKPLISNWYCLHQMVSCCYLLFFMMLFPL